MYFLEGNQSVGKSTFLKLVQKHIPEIEIELEPLESWQKKRHGQSLLKSFFDDIPRWAYTTDTFTMMCRVREQLINQQNPNPNRILERSIFSGYYGYAMSGYTLGGMTDMEWQLYNEWFDYLTVNCRPPIGFIYLKVDPEIAYKRSKKRNRDEEKSATLDFFKLLGRLHDDFLIHKKNVKPQIKDVPVLVLDCNAEFERDQKNLEQHFDKVKQFLLDTQIHMPAQNKVPISKTQKH
ncbi:deoxynucleoside kinase [Candidatus Dependentiae bacterium]